MKIGGAQLKESCTPSPNSILVVYSYSLAMATKFDVVVVTRCQERQWSTCVSFFNACFGKNSCICKPWLSYHTIC